MNINFHENIKNKWYCARNIISYDFKKIKPKNSDKNSDRFYDIYLQKCSDIFGRIFCINAVILAKPKFHEDYAGNEFK